MENVWSFRFKEMGSSSRSSFLVEASGDSDNNTSFDHQHPSSVNDDDDDDDAGSCSCDASDYYSCVQFEKLESDHQEESSSSSSSTTSSSSVHVLGKGSFEAAEEEEEEDEVLQKIHHGLERWGGDSGNLKPCVSVDSTTNEPINDKEKNRLFWEACLAS